MSKQQVAELRALLKGYCEHVPPAVNAGSYNTALDFKDKVRAARRVLGKDRVAVSELQAAISSLDTYWQSSTS